MALMINQTLMQPNMQSYLNQVLGEKKEQFVQACISVVSANPKLQRCDPVSVITAAMSAATLNLSTNPNLGEAYLIPYGSRCQLQVGYLGLIQMAMKTGMVARINVTDVREGETKFHRLTGDIEWTDVEDRDNKPVVGYCAYLRLTNGFEKYLYMTIEELRQHRSKYSKAENSPWDTDFDKMASKTVLKQLVRKYCPKSIELQRAVEYDQAVLRPDYETGGVTTEYVDSPLLPAADAEAKAETAEMFDMEA